jgi:hypothetical protein
MKLERYVTQFSNGRLIRRGDAFQLFDMACKLAFYTDSSAVFDVGRVEDHHTFRGGTTQPGSIFKVVGFIEVHHPCNHHVKAHIRCSIPQTYLADHANMNIAVLEIFEALGIPSDETYVAQFITAESQGGVGNRRDVIS